MTVKKYCEDRPIMSWSCDEELVVSFSSLTMSRKMFLQAGSARYTAL